MCIYIKLVWEQKMKLYRVVGRCALCPHSWRNWGMKRWDHSTGHRHWLTHIALWLLSSGIINQSCFFKHWKYNCEVCTTFQHFVYMYVFFLLTESHWLPQGWYRVFRIPHIWGSFLYKYSKPSEADRHWSPLGRKSRHTTKTLQFDKKIGAAWFSKMG